MLLQVLLVQACDMNEEDGKAIVTLLDAELGDSDPNYYYES